MIILPLDFDYLKYRVCEKHKFNLFWPKLWNICW